MLFIRVAAIPGYSVALRDMWLRSFGKEHILSLQSIKKRLENIMKVYTNSEYTNVLLKISHQRTWSSSLTKFT